MNLVSLASQTLSVSPITFSILKGIGTAGRKGSESNWRCRMERVWLVRPALSRGVLVTLFCPDGESVVMISSFCSHHTQGRRVMDG